MADKLMKKIAAGDKSALHRLYAEYNGLVFAVAMSVLKNRFDAEDTAADTFVAVMKNAATFRGGSVKAYLASTARNLAINSIKRRRREVFTDFTENESLYGEYKTEQQFADNVALSEALAMLEDTERDIVLMYNAGMKHREIAEVLSLPLGTVTWRYGESLKKLRKYLDE